MDFKGFLLINKPVGITSFDVIRRIKRLLPRGTKIGHAGTLDPFASGLLIIAISREATREMSKIMTLDKVYQATGKLGQLTDTLDCMGVIGETKDVMVNRKELEQALVSFGSSYVQIPPLYSALKVGGKPLYKHVRMQSGPQIDVAAVLETKKREIQLYNLELCTFEFPLFTIRAHVSHGTYIRSLINDIAQKCNTVATTIQLCRESIGPFTLSQAIELNEIYGIADMQEALWSPEQFIAQLIDYCPKI